MATKDAVPFVSIIMPVYNEAAFIEEGLNCLLAQDYPNRAMEILVVDGMSNDNTRDIVRQFISRIPQVPIRLLDNPSRIVPTALNLGLQQAKGDVIVRVDGHTLIAVDYISKSIEALKRSGAECVGGLMSPVGIGWIGETIALAHNLRFGLGGGVFHRAAQETEADTVYMGVFRREVFEKAGLFDEDLIRNQDIELNGRIRKSGGRIVLSPLVKSTYFCRTSLAALGKQNFMNGLWLLPTIQKCPGSLSIRHFVPLAFISFLLVGVIVGAAFPSGWIMLAAILGSYIAASLLSTIAASACHGWRFFIPLPVVFATLHFSYGAGSLMGLFRSIGRQMHMKDSHVSKHA